MNLRYADPAEWWLEISPEAETASWKVSQAQASRLRQGSYFLNDLCLRVFLPWFRNEYAPSASIWPDRGSLNNLWEFVNGVGVRLGRKRLVLLPTEDLDCRELEAPQEWVDIPSLAGDYYLGVQLNLEESWLRVWGYTTHEALKEQAEYDEEARSYCLGGAGLSRDLTAFWGACQFCPDASTQASLTALPSLTGAAAVGLIEKLSQANIGFPREVVSFERWGPLMARADWRRQLYKNRLDSLERAVAGGVEPLHRWFETDWIGGWRTIEAFLGAEPQLALTSSLRGIAAASGANEQRVKLIELKGEAEPESVVLLMELTSEDDGRVGVRVQVHPPKGRRHVPAQLTLGIYSTTDELLQSIRSREQDDYIQLPLFRCLPGTKFQLKVGLGEDYFSENFAV
ncbi:MAG: DUF1822 family protein [Leptolyngbyaceae cyanobacterium MO_188.B28]|nr:DUF1822 family protein [Leptolyngbyaceae cyanobacterium MO_188.B28]